MLYLLDANVLIDAARDYYPLDRVPEFWGWLLWRAQNEVVKIPDEMWREVVRGSKDDLVAWARAHRKELVYKGEVNTELVRRVLEEGYGPRPDRVELEKIGGDPFLVAYGMESPEGITVVTNEKEGPSKTRSNRRLPDVCRQFGVEAIDVFDLVRRLDFRTDWAEGKPRLLP